MKLKRLKGLPRPTRLLIDLDSDVALREFSRIVGEDLAVHYLSEGIFSRLGTVTAVHATSYGDDERRAEKRGAARARGRK